MPPKQNKIIEEIKQAQTKAKKPKTPAQLAQKTKTDFEKERLEEELTGTIRPEHIKNSNKPTKNPTLFGREKTKKEKMLETRITEIKKFIEETEKRQQDASVRKGLIEDELKKDKKNPTLLEKKSKEAELIKYYKYEISKSDIRLKTAERQLSSGQTMVQEDEESESEDEKAGAQAVIEDTSTKSKTETKNVKVIDVQLPDNAQSQANLAGGLPFLTDQEFQMVAKNMAIKAKEGGLEAYYKEQEPKMTEKQKQLASTFSFNAQISKAQQANAGQNTGSQNAMCYDDNSATPKPVNPASPDVVSKDGSSINPEIQKGDNVIIPPNPATETTKTDTGTIVGNANGRPITAEQTNLITVRDTGKKDEREMAFLQRQGDGEGEVFFGSSDESKSNGPQTAGGAGAGASQMAGIGAGGGKPPDRPYKTTAFTNEQISRFIQAQNEANMRNSMQSQIEQNLKADSEKQKTIGDRMRVGLDTYGDIPKADILVKSDNERLKSLHSFVNNRWIESVQNSKRGNLSVLKEMDDMEEKLKYSRLYTMAYNPIPVDQEDLIKKNYKFIARNISQRLTPAIDNITELSPEGRPVGALPPSLHNIGAYNYRHEGIYGTTDLGLSQNLPDLLMPDYRLNSLQYPNVLYDMNNDRYRYI